MRRLTVSIVLGVILASGMAGARPQLPPDPTAVRGVVTGQYTYRIHCSDPNSAWSFGHLSLAGQFNFGKVWRGIVQTGVRLPCSSTDRVYGPWDPIPMHGTGPAGATSVTGECTPDWLRSTLSLSTGYLESSLSCEGTLITSSADEINWRTTLFIVTVINAEPLCYFLGCSGTAAPDFVRVNGAFFRGVAS
jgi:hypothetical protein